MHLFCAFCVQKKHKDVNKGRLYMYHKSNKEFWEELIAYFPWYDTGDFENDASNNSSIVACVFVTAVTFLPSRCLATIREILPSRCLATIRGYTDIHSLLHTHTHTHRAMCSHKPTLFFQNKESRLKTLILTPTLPSWIRFEIFVSINNTT
jgi:hypothetical protein